MLLPEGVRIGEHDTCSPGESGWSCFGQRCAPRVIRGRGPYNAPLLTCRFCPSRIGGLKIIVTSVYFLRSSLACGVCPALACCSLILRLSDLRCPAHSGCDAPDWHSSVVRLGTRAKKADVYVGTSFVLSEQGRGVYFLALC